MQNGTQSVFSTLPLPFSFSRLLQDGPVSCKARSSHTDHVKPVPQRISSTSLLLPFLFVNFFPLTHAGSQPPSYGGSQEFTPSFAPHSPPQPVPVAAVLPSSIFDQRCTPSSRPKQLRSTLRIHVHAPQPLSHLPENSSRRPRLHRLDLPLQCRPPHQLLRKASPPLYSTLLPRQPPASSLRTTKRPTALPVLLIASPTLPRNSQSARSPTLSTQQTVNQVCSARGTKSWSGGRGFETTSGWFIRTRRRIRRATTT